MDNVIEIKDLCKNYKIGDTELQVLKDIDLTICKGEFVSIMGPSGSGKSTLLYLLGGLDKPTTGSIKIKGTELATMKDLELSLMRRRNIGFIFQFYNLIPNLTVEENIILPILLDGKKIKKYREKLDDILNDVGLYERKQHTPRELSGGQQQRVAIARALINEPDIILADEPTGNLDTKTGIEILKLFEEINSKKGKTIVQVTHSVEAAEFGQRLVNVRDGRVN